MKLSEVLSLQSIHLGIDAEDKYAAMRYLVDRLVEGGKIDGSNSDAVYQGLVDRERIMSTGMDHGVAIPHCSSDLVSDVVGVIGLSSEGIPFETRDGLPARIIVLLVTPKDRFQAHVRTLAGVARLLNHEEFRNALLEASTAEAVFDVFQNFE